MTHETVDLGANILREVEICARDYGVAPRIHPADHIFHFIVQETPDEADAVRDYFRGGAGAADWLRRMVEIFRSTDQPFSLLEFAAGYGRVSRHLSKALPTARIVSSDIHPAAVSFLDSLGVEGHRSTPRPETFAVGESFDVIFALSFFTHMPKATWGGWLRALLRHLKPDGCLVFTTHGLAGMKVMGDAAGRRLDWDNDGFWFAPMSEQKDIDADDYGSAGTSFRFVQDEIVASGASLFLFQERGAGYQDVYIVRHRDDFDHRSTAVATGRRGTMPRRSAPRKVANADDCIFYHTMEVPGLGLVKGQWDLRGVEDACLGGTKLAGKSVLEIGPASGYLTFWMERQGARVTSFDLDDTEKWDLVPFAGLDPATIHAERAQMIRRLNNSWWYTRAAVGSKADCLNGTVYDIDPSIGTFDVVTINSVLLHLRDPLLAVERAASVAKDRIVITDVAERQFASDRPELMTEKILRFIPSVAAAGPVDGWWYIPSAMLKEFLQILGFHSIEITNFKAEICDGHMWDLYTIVGQR